MSDGVLRDVLGKTALIDGDIIRYRCGFAAERIEYLVTNGDYIVGSPDSHREAIRLVKLRAGEGKDSVIWSRKEVEPLENCLQMVRTTLEAMRENLKWKDYELHLSGPRNFRDRIATTKKYKGNRDNMAKPKYYDEIGEYLVKNWGAVYSDGIEADDVIGIRAGELGESSIIVSTDKDLDQIAGWHFHWVNCRVYRISRKQGDFNLYSQVLTGDPVDNVPGLKGVGEKGAQEILQGAENSTRLRERAYAAYLDRLGDQAKAFFDEQYNLVYILRNKNEMVSSRSDDRNPTT